MQRIAFLFALVFTTQAYAADAARCGIDAFGNTICMDQDGVLTNSPKEASIGRSDGEAKGKGAPGSGADHRVISDVEEKNGSVRCGMDPFGNKVCRQ